MGYFGCDWLISWLYLRAWISSSSISIILQHVSFIQAYGRVLHYNDYTRLVTVTSNQQKRGKAIPASG
jgi:hypothetical protein